MAERRFPAPWSVEETDACFIVRGANGQAQAWRRARLEYGGPRMPDRCDALPYGAGERLDKSTANAMPRLSATNETTIRKV
jgi:hypothetical protein